jgi:hypothetical protein
MRPTLRSECGHVISMVCRQVEKLSPGFAAGGPLTPNELLMMGAAPSVRVGPGADNRPEYGWVFRYYDCSINEAQNKAQDGKTVIYPAPSCIGLRVCVRCQLLHGLLRKPVRVQ